MHRLRLFVCILFAMILAGSHQVMVTAAPIYVLCSLPNATEMYIVVDSFGGMAGALHQCVHYWHGNPRGVVM